MKKLLFVTLPIIILITILSSEVESLNFAIYSVENVLFLYYTLTLAISSASLLTIINLRARKDFTFYFAKGYCKFISEKEDYSEKFRYLRLLLGSYDEYLRRKFKVGIDEKKIYSIILYKKPEERNQILNSICESLDGDKLSLANYLSSIHKVPDSEFYIEETLRQQLKPIAIFLAAAIPIIISIVTSINTLLMGK
jgi:hypothetical protein